MSLLSSSWLYYWQSTDWLVTESRVGRSKKSSPSFDYPWEELATICCFECLTSVWKQTKIKTTIYNLDIIVFGILCSWRYTPIWSRLSFTARFPLIGQSQNPGMAEAKSLRLTSRIAFVGISRAPARWRIAPNGVGFYTSSFMSTPVFCRWQPASAGVYWLVIDWILHAVEGKGNLYIWTSPRRTRYQLKVNKLSILHGITAPPAIGYRRTNVFWERAPLY